MQLHQRLPFFLNLIIIFSDESRTNTEFTITICLPTSFTPPMLCQRWKGLYDRIQSLFHIFHRPKTLDQNFLNTCLFVKQMHQRRDVALYIRITNLPALSNAVMPTKHLLQCISVNDLYSTGFILILYPSKVAFASLIVPIIVPILVTEEYFFNMVILLQPTFGI